MLLGKCEMEMFYKREKVELPKLGEACIMFNWKSSWEEKVCHLIQKLIILQLSLSI